MASPARVGFEQRHFMIRMRVECPSCCQSSGTRTHYSDFHARVYDEMKLGRGDGRRARATRATSGSLLPLSPRPARRLLLHRCKAMHSVHAQLQPLPFPLASGRHLSAGKHAGPVPIRWQSTRDVEDRALQELNSGCSDSRGSRDPLFHGEATAVFAPVAFVEGVMRGGGGCRGWR